MKSRQLGVVLALGFLLVIPVGRLRGQQSPTYDLHWSTIDGGGGISYGTTFVLRGTIGQPEGGISFGPAMELSGGFWYRRGCVVDLGDLAAFANQWLLTGQDLAADLDENGEVDLLDYALLAEAWMCYCPDGWPWSD